MNIKEDYVSFEVAKLLKEKGFDGICRAGYTSHGNLHVLEVKEFLTNKTCPDTYWECVAPTLQMACKWLREYKKLVISIDLNYSDNSYSYLIDSIIEHRIVGNGLGETYEEAVEVALKYVLENLI